jgi:hypothetical protein
VGDRSTIRFVSKLYTALADGRPVADALQWAKLAARRAGLPPGVWAAFQVVGDPSVVVPLTRPPGARTRWWWLAAGALLGAVAAGAAVRRRLAS